MFKNVLLPLDGSHIAECVLPYAVALGRATGAELQVIHVLEKEEGANSEQSTDPLDWHLRKAEAETYLQEVTKRLSEQGLVADSILLQGQASEKLVEFIRKNDVDLMILSSHGQSGLSGWNVSSVVQKIIYRANTSIMIVPAYQAKGDSLSSFHYERLLVPLDGSKRAESVLPLVNALASADDTEVSLVNVVVRPEMPRRVPLTPEDDALAERIVTRNREEGQKYLDHVKARLDQPAQVRLTTSDNLIATLHDLAQEDAYDLVILSAHGYSGDRERPFGSVATSFIAYGNTPLLIVQDLPAKEIESTRAEEVAEQSGKSDSGKGGRTTVHASN